MINPYSSNPKPDSSPLVGAIITFVLVSLICLCFVVRLHHITKPTAEADLTPKQLMAELRHVQADLERTKLEVAQMIADAKIEAATVNTNNLNVQWVPFYNGNQVTLMTSPDGNPMLWGFRADGVVLWKTQ